ncbi:MAG TPA: TonB-dependent receptor [Longimicrobium sp.]|nr:TonB-dependent receptor [Longimicrobium sp.]
MSITRSYPHARNAALAAALLSALIAVPALAQATGSVDGTVTARGTGVPLAGVSVRVEGAAPAATDAQGHFHISRVPSGTHTLTATRLGLAPLSRPVTVTANAAERADLQMSEESTVLPSLVVSSTREVRRLGETPASVGVVGSAALRDAKPTHPAEVMSQVPGVWVSVTGGEGHTTAIRQPKTTNPVYLFLEDGVPTRSTGFFNHNALYEVNVPQADRIEVLKGPASALYGSDAIGGVINVETRAPTARPSYEAYAEGGAYGWGRLLLAGSATAGSNGVRADLNVTRTSGWRQGTDYTRQSGNLRWDHHFGDGASLKTVLAVSHINQQTAGASTLLAADFRADPTQNYTPISFRRVTALRLSTDYERQGARTLLSVIPFVRWNSMDLLPDWSLTYDPTVYTTGHHSFGMLAKYRVDVDPLRTRVIGGVDVDYSPGYRNEDRIQTTRTGQVFDTYTAVERVYDYHVTFRGVSPYLQTEVAPVSRVRLTGGVRWDNIGFAYDNQLSAVTTGKYRRPNDTTVAYHHLSPKLGVTYEAGRAFNVFGSYTTGFRSPSEGQLFRQGQADNTVSLKPVEARSVEAGARGQVGPLGYQVSAYRMRITHDVLTFVNPDGTRETVNAGGTLHRGIETGLGIQLPARFRADVSYSRAKHTYQEWSPKPGTDYAGHEMESAPRTLLNARLGWSFAGDGRLSAEWQRVGGYWEDPQNTHRYDGHSLVNLHATVPVRGGVELVGRMNNVLDERYAEAAQYTVARGEELAPGMPRSLYLGVQLRAGH